MEAVIFDMDGLLVDSEPLWRQAEQMIFPKVGVQLTDAMCMQTMGTRVDEVVRHWYARKPWTGPTLEEVQREIVDTVIDLVKARGKALPGVRDVLEFFSERGMPLALASSSSPRIIDAVVDTLGIRAYFQALRSAEHEPFGKPHPGVFLEAARALEADPRKCLVFEDSFAGMISALAARMRVVVVPDAVHYDDPRFGAAQLKLRSLEEFDEECLQRLTAEAAQGPG